MKVFVAGATGVCGWRAVRELVRAGHDVTALARSDAKARLVDDLGGKPVRCDVFDRADTVAHAGGHDAVVNLLTHVPPTSQAAFVRGWRENDRIRREASANLAAAAREGGGRMIQESLAFTYQDGADQWLTEESPLGIAPHTETTVTAEHHALSLADGVVLRLGMFYAPDSPQSHQQVQLAKLGLAMLPGPDDAYASYIYADDIATAVVAALAVPGGVYNVVDDEPMRRVDAASALAAAVGKKRLHAGPMRAMAHTKVMNLIKRSQRVSNNKFKQATGWAPSVPSQREGWPLILKEMGA
jgi:nucleoside-diphosphate-sugar epimerase